MQAELNDLHTESGVLEKLLQQPRQENGIREKLAQAVRRADVLESQVKSVSNELHVAVRGVQGRLGLIRKELNAQDDEQKLFKEFTTALQDGTSAGAYVKTLERYLKQLPETSRGQSFQRALDEERVW